jgi:hypothetical protein
MDPAADPITTEMMAATAMVRGGDRPGGRRRLEALLLRIAEDPSPFLECVVCHHLADAQDELADELAWDVRALDAALRCTEAEAQRHRQALPLAAFMPSLHVNLAEDYFKLGDTARSREHLAAARGFTGALPDDAYGQMIRRGIERLGKRIDADASG